MKNGYILPDRLYGVLKWACLIALPAAATLLSTIGPVWGMDSGLCDNVVVTLNAVGAFVGILIGVSAVSGSNG